jgi:tryptophan synthase alpha chain
MLRRFQMNRIDALFKSKPEKVLSVYMTAGYPELDDTTAVIHELVNSGVDLIEIGMPFSDPLADGPVLQDCNQRSLVNGMSLELLFRQISGIRSNVKIPLILMGYLNPVLNYGFEQFCSKASECGVDGLILPDLPPDEYEKDYLEICRQNGLHMIFLITPQTDDQRVHRIASLSGGFLYMVSSASTTGVKKGFQPGQIDYFKRISEMNLKLPRLIGFGISSAGTFREACQYANGAIIGSAFMKSLGGSGSLEEKISAFIKSLELPPSGSPVK